MYVHRRNVGKMFPKSDSDSLLGQSIRDFYFLHTFLYFPKFLKFGNVFVIIRKLNWLSQGGKVPRFVRRGLLCPGEFPPKTGNCSWNQSLEFTLGLLGTHVTLGHKGAQGNEVKKSWPCGWVLQMGVRVMSPALPLPPEPHPSSPYDCECSYGASLPKLESKLYVKRAGNIYKLFLWGNQFCPCSTCGFGYSLAYTTWKLALLNHFIVKHYDHFTQRIS